MGFFKLSKESLSREIFGKNLRLVPPWRPHSPVGHISEIRHQLCFSMISQYLGRVAMLKTTAPTKPPMAKRDVVGLPRRAAPRPTETASAIQYLRVGVIRPQQSNGWPQR